MGQHYRSDTKDGAVGFIKAMWKSARWCQWVEPNEGATGENANVLFYRNVNKLGVPPAKLAAPGQEKRMKTMMVQVEDDSE